jgi:hypothetical protein
MATRYQIIAGIGYDREGRQLANPAALVRSLADVATKTFGGVTILSGQGHWLDKGKVVSEDSIIFQIDVVTGECLDDDVMIPAFAKTVRNVLSQSSVMIVRQTLDELVFVSAD